MLDDETYEKFKEPKTTRDCFKNVTAEICTIKHFLEERLNVSEREFDTVKARVHATIDQMIAEAVERYDKETSPFDKIFNSLFSNL